MPSPLPNEDAVDRTLDSKTSDGRLACADKTWLYITRFDCLVGLPLDDDWGEEPGRTLACMIALGAVLFVISAALAFLELL